MDESSAYQSETIKENRWKCLRPTKKGNQLLRLIRAAQPISRTEIANRLGVDKSTVTENVKPLLSKRRAGRGNSSVKRTGTATARFVICYRPRLFYRRKSRRSAQRRSVWQI